MSGESGMTCHAIGRVLARRRLTRIDEAERAGAELNYRRHPARLDVVVGRNEVRHRLGADAPFQRPTNVLVETFGGETRRLVQGQVQAEQRPSGVFEIVELLLKRRR